jgi:hypothetical protein
VIMDLDHNVFLLYPLEIRLIGLPSVTAYM